LARFSSPAPATTASYALSLHDALPISDSRPPVQQARTALAKRSRCVRCPAMGKAPSGTVTFLFTDVVGSTGLWERAPDAMRVAIDRKSTRLNSSHSQISYAVFCLKKKR